MAAAARHAGGSSFTRINSPSSSSATPSPSPQSPGIKPGPNSTSFISSGIPDLDNAEAPHHLSLLRNFMAQGLVHNQPILFASPSNNPRAFLGTLPPPLASEDERRRGGGRGPDTEDQVSGLRIAWQYKKYFGDQQLGDVHNKDRIQDFCTDFDLRKTVDRHVLSAQRIDCISIQDSPIKVLSERCSSFLTKLSRNNGSYGSSGRIAIQSLGAPQSAHFEMDWDMVCFIRSLKAMLRSSNAVAVITFPNSVLPPAFSKRWQHLADTLLSVRAIPDEDKDLAKLLTGYQDMVGLLHVHKVAHLNTQVPIILEATTFSMKVQRRRSLVLERLNQAPIDASGGSSHAASSSCSGSSRGSPLDF